MEHVAADHCCLDRRLVRWSTDGHLGAGRTGASIVLETVTDESVAARPKAYRGELISSAGWTLDLERARMGRSGVGLSRVVSDLLERKGFEFGGELAQSPGVVQQWAQGIGLGGVQGAGDGLVVTLRVQVR